MNKQNIDPDKNNKNNSEPNQANPAQTGLDKWNDRLDNNLEPADSNDELADENARKFSAEKGSGDQSDAATSGGREA